MRRSLIFAAILAGGLAPAPVWSQVEAPRAVPAADWTVTLGVEGRVLPAFEGSDRYVVRPFPIVDIRRAGTPRRFSSPRDGVSVAIVNVGQFRFGPSGKASLPRRESDDPGLRGLGDVDWTLEIGAFAEYWVLPWLRTRAELRQGIGGHHGLVSEITADVVVPATETLTLSAGPRLILATAAALRPYFGVDAAQSVTSGMPVYDPEGGIRSVGLGAQLRQQWSAQWATNVFLEYDRLVGDAARSPILSRSGSADQVTVGLGLSYSFNISLQ
ncbi:MAG: MipA/OmpV family protein [Rhizobiales bacterium]|nr:MipA/OmpV family protein [Hyphomicrobiales bacterium]